MEINFSQQDVEKILYDSFCNGGLDELCASSVCIDWDYSKNAFNYTSAKNRLVEQGEEDFCREDVYMEILTGGDSLIFTDYENEEVIYLSLSSVLLNFNSLDNESKMEVAQLLDEDNSCDAFDCYNALQYALYSEVIFG
jgi:hypothetical protein